MVQLHYSRRILKHLQILRFRVEGQLRHFLLVLMQIQTVDHLQLFHLAKRKLRLLLVALLGTSFISVTKVQLLQALVKIRPGQLLRAPLLLQYLDKGKNPLRLARIMLTATKARIQVFSLVAKLHQLQPQPPVVLSHLDRILRHLCLLECLEALILPAQLRLVHPRKANQPVGVYLEQAQSCKRLAFPADLQAKALGLVLVHQGCKTHSEQEQLQHPLVKATTTIVVQLVQVDFQHLILTFQVRIFTFRSLCSLVVCHESSSHCFCYSVVG